MTGRAHLRLRKWLSATLFLLGLAAMAGQAPGIPAAAASNPVVTENQQPGSTGWRLGSLVADDVNGQIKGYASATSVLQGGSLTLYVTVNPAQTYTIDFYRVGWYGGLGGRLELHAGPINGATQPSCPTDPSTGLIACNWTPGYTLTVPSDWTSGAYLAVLTNAAGYQNYAVFVVRDGRPAAFLYQQGINTDEAYNNYPDDQATGKSLYDYNSYGATTVAGTSRAVKVSFDRPMTGDGSGNFLNWDIQLIRWLEKSGYDVTYSTDVDTHANGGDLLNHRGFFSAGHDEYWSNEMYSAAQQARDAGVNLAFFGANAVYWQTRYEAAAGGAPNRVLVCYKSAGIDPVQGPTTTVLWRSTQLNRPEQTLMGVQFTSEVGWGRNVAYAVTNSANWVYAGTGFHDGDTVAGIVGYEMDRYMSNYPAPNGTSWTLLSQSPFTNTSGLADYANSSIYQAPSGAWVFATGTMSWSWALDNFQQSVSTDPRIQQTTATILDSFLSSNLVHDLKVTVPASVTAGQAFPMTVTAENAQGATVTSYNGTVHFSSSDTSAGVVLPPDSTLTNGQGSFSATLIKAAPQTLTASDAANNLSTTVNLTVNAAPASTLALATTTASTAAGTSFSFTVTASDGFGNIASSYPGTVHFTSSDTSPGVALPPDSTLSNGQGSFSATLDRAGTQTVTGTDSGTASITGSLSIRITPGAAASLKLVTPAAAVVNQSFNVTVTLVDQFGNVATGYRGTVYFSSSDLLAMQLGKLPADYTFTAGDGGTHTFSATLMTPPSQTITVADTANGNLSATSPPITVNPI